MFQYWWSWTKYALLVVFFTTVFGCLYAILGVEVLFTMNYPDYYIEEHGKSVDWLDPSGTCPTAHLVLFFKVAFAAFCGTS